MGFCVSVPIHCLGWPKDDLEIDRVGHYWTD